MSNDKLSVNLFRRGYRTIKTEYKRNKENKVILPDSKINVFNLKSKSRIISQELDWIIYKKLWKK